MKRKDAEEDVLQRPFAPVMIQYVLVVLQILRQLLVPHQTRSLPLRLHLHLRLHLYHLRMMISLIVQMLLPLPMVVADHKRRRNPRRLFFSGEEFAVAGRPLSGGSGLLQIYVYRVLSSFLPSPSLALVRYYLYTQLLKGSGKVQRCRSIQRRVDGWLVCANQMSKSGKMEVKGPLVILKSR